MVRDELIDALKQLLSEGPPLKLALLFGSAARGSERPDSDLDIAILPVDRELALADELSLQSRLALFAKREVDLVRLDHCTPAIRFRVAKEGIALVSAPRTLSAFRARAGIEHAELAPLVRRANELFLKRVRVPVAANGAR